ncbi:MAG: hypothetical protein E7361_01080 [Clostridiales bacterium]|nr:hypothetical protein [Clostridiales bacterium]
MERDKKFYYIFINIKGALYTADWIKFTQSAVMAEEDHEYTKTVHSMLEKHPEWNSYYKTRMYMRSKHIRKICPYNVEALNTLIDELSDNYDINLVVTSHKWKELFDIKTIPALVKNGLDYNHIVLDKTDTRIEDTTKGIKDYLAQVGNPSNYLVIDYQKELEDSFPSDKLILCEERKSGLNEELVNLYLHNSSAIDGSVVTSNASMDYDAEYELV